jgi:hypothetical protein
VKSPINHGLSASPGDRIDAVPAIDDGADERERIGGFCHGDRLPRTSEREKPATTSAIPSHSGRVPSKAV